MFVVEVNLPGLSRAIKSIALFSNFFIIVNIFNHLPLEFQRKHISLNGEKPEKVEACFQKLGKLVLPRQFSNVKTLLEEFSMKSLLVVGDSLFIGHGLISHLTWSETFNASHPEH